MRPSTRLYPILYIAAVLVVASVGASAQGERPGFLDLRFDEDWTQFSRDENDPDPFDAIKNIRLGDSTKLSIGGQTRLRWESWSNFGFNHKNDDSYLYWRAFLHTDWHFGDHVRLYIEGKTANLTERRLPGERRTIDEDELDIQNAFLELNHDVGDLHLKWRLGRQELRLGNQRLLSPLDWANTRVIFDGARFTLSRPDRNWTLDAFWTVPVQVRQHKFNHTNSDRNWFGLYYKTKLTEKLNIESYLFYLDHDDRHVPIDSDRYTVGGRLYGNIAKGLSFEVEGAYQWGNKNNLDISAWFLVAEMQYQFKEVKTTPWIMAGYAHASGDDDPADHDNDSFNALFPFAHYYLGFIDHVGRSNIVDAYAQLGFWPVEKKLRFKADVHVFWLDDEDDALYSPAHTVIRAGGVDEKSVGWEIDLTATYLIDRHTTAHVGFSRFFAGSFIDKTGSDDDINWFWTSVKYMF